MNILDQLRDYMIGKRYFKHDPQHFVVVLNVCKASRGYQVLFKPGASGQPVFCAYSKFVKNYPNEVTE